jgi:protein-S-isoprenylcysteine O-methyltransferase Ste14
MVLIFGGVGLSQRNWISLAIMLIFPTAALLYRIHVEELALSEAFGDDYVQYRRSTFRLIPGIF